MSGEYQRWKVQITHEAARVVVDLLVRGSSANQNDIRVESLDLALDIVIAAKGENLMTIKPESPFSLQERWRS